MREKMQRGNILWRAGGLEAIFDPKRAAWISMKGVGDEQRTEYLLTPEEFPEYDGPDARWLGNLLLEITDKYYGKRIRISTASMENVRKMYVEDKDIRIEYLESSVAPGLSIQEEYKNTNQGILWKIHLKNRKDERLYIRRMEIPLLMNQYFRGDDEFKYEQCVLRHACICHQNSWFYWAKSSGDMPLLILKTMGDTAIDGFRVEHEDPRWSARGSMGEAFEGAYYICPVDEKTEEYPEQTGTVILEAGRSLSFSFLISMQESYQKAWKWLAENGGFYLQSVPGMAVPLFEEARLTIICAQMPQVIGEDPTDQAGEVRSTGENRWELSISLGGCGRRNYVVKVGAFSSRIVFWGMERPEEIYRKQAAFITQNQRETDPSDPCWHGLLMWDMELKRRINSSCNPYGPNWFAGGSDEIGLVSGLFLSEWNVYRPDQKQIHVLQEYCRDFIEERLTEQPGWKVHRMVPWFEMFDDWKERGADDIWRAFNYVHVVNTYYNMYRIAQRYAYDWMDSKEIWLKKAYEYARAMFTYWMFPNGEGALKYGNMGETVLAVELAEALRREDMLQESSQIEGLVKRKAACFAEKRYPYGSEMAYDSTAFEAVYAYGKVAGNKHVMKSSMNAALANRGRQPVWYLYMTDLRAGGDSTWNVSYMTQLGACTIQDWVLEEKNYDMGLARAFVASYLAGFSLYNSGGYYSNAPENEGASGWTVTGEYGMFSGRRKDPVMKGCVAMSGESALGYYGALRCACSVVGKEDGVWVALECSLKQQGKGYCCEPQDGLRIRFYDMENDWAVKLERDALRKICYKPNKIEFHVENITGDRHMCRFQIRMPEEGLYRFLYGKMEQSKTHKLTSCWNSIEIEFMDTVEMCVRIEAL